MAVSIHRKKDGQFIFDLDDKKCELLAIVFENFKRWTGISIDIYGETLLTTDNQQTLIKVIDEYIEIADLNKNKQKTIALLELRTLMIFFLSNGHDVKFLGD